MNEWMDGSGWLNKIYIECVRKIPEWIYYCESILIMPNVIFHTFFLPLSLILSYRRGQFCVRGNYLFSNILYFSHHFTSFFLNY